MRRTACHAAAESLCILMLTRNIGGNAGLEKTATTPEAFVSKSFALCDAISPVDCGLTARAKARLDNLTKPPGSLGRLEDAAARLYCIGQGRAPLRVDPAIMFTVAGDHGVAAEGVSAFPQEVTRQMVANFLKGGAAVNALCRAVGMDLRVVDAGCVGGAFAPHPLLMDVRCGDGTANFTQGPAMSEDMCRTALERGADLADVAAEQRYACVGVGEMGIANTTSATALYCALLHLEPENVAGPGTGASPEMIRRKAQVVRRACAANAAALERGEPLGILAALGGFEIAVMAGIMLGAARRRLPVLVDGFISTAAFAAARALCPAVQGYCFLSHASAEPGYAAALGALDAERPLLDLGLRLGEGTGAALALHLLRSAAAVFNDMATFAQAGVMGEPDTK